MSKIGLFWITYLVGIITLIAASVEFNFWRWLLVFVAIEFVIMLIEFHYADTYYHKHEEKENRA